MTRLRTIVTTTSLALVAATGIALAQHSPASTEVRRASCSLTSSDKANNATLSFDDFDQKGTTPATARQLAKSGCYKEAAEATEDYLLNAAIRLVYFQRVLIFHEGQYRALAGDEIGAARIIAGSKDPTQTPNPELDWNTYVDGTWAFFVKDRPKLETAFAKLKSEPGARNAVNAAALSSLIKCFGGSYLQTTSAGCR